MKITIIAEGGASVALDKFRDFDKTFLSALRVAIVNWTLRPPDVPKIEQIENGYTIQVESLEREEKGG